MQVYAAVKNLIGKLKLENYLQIVLSAHRWQSIQHKFSLHCIRGSVVGARESIINQTNWMPAVRHEVQGLVGDIINLILTYKYITTKCLKVKGETKGYKKSLRTWHTDSHL